MKPSSVFLSVTGSMIVASRLYAQAPPARTNWEFTAAKGSTLTTASVGIVASTPVLLKHARFGIGVRGTFATGDLKLTPAGAKNVPAGVVDTLHASARALMFNISGHVSALVTRRLEAGMNIDLVGLGTGGSRESRYRASAAATPVTVDASPATTNVFLYG